VRSGQRQMAVVNLQLTGLQNDRAQLFARINAVQALLQNVQQEIMFAQPDGRRTGPPRNRSPDGLQAQLNSYAVSLALLNQQLARLDHRIAGLRSQFAQASSQFQQGSQSLATGKQTVEKAADRIQALERKAQRLEESEPKASAALAAKMRSLSTYYAFPYEQEKTRVLAWFAPAAR
jgi:chromosome segregation ATPase